MSKVDIGDSPKLPLFESNVLHFRGFSPGETVANIGLTPLLQEILNPTLLFKGDTFHLQQII